MNLGELLYELRFNILNDRTDRVEGTSDYMWTDATLVRFIDEAQRRLAIHGLVIRDSVTPEVTEVRLEEGTTHYTLHDSVIAVISARRSDDMADLRRTGHPMLGAYRPASETWEDLNGISGLPPGRVMVYSTDDGVVTGDTDAVSNVSLRVYPTPNDDEDGTVLKLRVVRKPIERLRAGNTSAELEIPEEHHLEILDWAAYLALRIVDDDAGNPKRALEFRASFEETVKRARMLAMRKMYAPTPWGFGRNGFTWER